MCVCNSVLGKSLQLNEIYNEFNPRLLALVFHRDDQIIKMHFSPTRQVFPERVRG